MVNRLHFFSDRADKKVVPTSTATLRFSRPYDALIAEMKSSYRVAIRKWKRAMSGAAYELTYPDGSIRRIITSPKPRGPVSAAIFLHEVGHHAVGFRRYPSRLLEEYYAWQWAFRQMASRNIPLDPRVLRHYRRSLRHYALTARTRGERIPHEVLTALTDPSLN